MGGCIGVHRGGRRTVAAASENIPRPQTGHIGKNRSLSQEILRWKSDVPLTAGQLRSRRDEFWDTAPAFEGRKEIWDALRAAAKAFEDRDFQMAQAIIDGANVTIPSGYLTECYDELGNRYQVPIYCLSNPVNMVRESCGRESPADSTDLSDGSEVTLKLRLSTSLNDVKLTVMSNDSIAAAKRRLQAQEGVDSSRQRWYFGGRLLGERLKLSDAKIPAGYVVQVIITPSDMVPVES